MKLLRLSNFTLKWDNAPADYGSLFYVSEVISAFDFAVGALPLSVVVRFFMRRERQINVLSLIGIIPLYIFMNATGFRIHMSENLRNEYYLIYVNHSWLVMTLYVLTLIFFALSVFSFFIKPIFRTVIKISLLILSILSVVLAVKFDQPNFFLPLSGSYLVLSLSVFNDKNIKNQLVK